MKNRGVVCLLLLLLAGLWSVPAWSDSRGKSYQLLGDFWISQIGRHEKTVKDLHEALQGDIDNLVRDLKQKKAEVDRNPDCKSLDCKQVGEMVQAMYRLQDRAKMAWIMADASRQWLSNYIDYGSEALSAMRKSAGTVEWADFLQNIAQPTADVAADIAISLYTGDPSTLSESLLTIGSEIGNFGINKVADLSTGYQSAAGKGGEQVTGALGGGSFTQAVVSNLTSSLSGVGVFSVSKGGMKVGFTPGASGMTTLKGAGGMVASAVVHSVLQALTANARAGVKKDLARVQKQLQQVMEEQVHLRIALVMQEKNIEMMRKHHTEVAELVTMLENVRDACKEVGKRKNCVKRFQTAIDKAKSEKQAKIGPLLRQIDQIDQRYQKARRQYRKDHEAEQKMHEMLRQARRKLARAKLFWKNRDVIEDLALHARDASKRDQYRKDLDELHRLGNPAPYRADVDRLSKAQSDLWNRTDADLKRIANLGNKRLDIRAKNHEAIQTADEVFMDAVIKARDQLATCTAPTFSPVHRSSVSSGQVKTLRSQRSPLMPDQYYTLLEQAMRDLDEDLYKTRINIKTSGDCKDGKILSGTIRDDEGSAVSGALAVVEIGGKQYTGSSGKGGRYQINLPQAVNIPDALIVTANKEGYNTGSGSAGRKHMQQVDIVLTAASADVIQIEKSLHHLGNNNYQGAANSRFQKLQTEGRDYQKGFTVKAEQIPSSNVTAEIVLTAKGSQRINAVFINKARIGGLGSTNSDGSATRVTIDFDVCALRIGRNVIRITSQVDENGDADDFEFANMQLVFKPEGASSQKDKPSAKLSAIRATERNFQSPLTSVAADGRFWISAKGESRCATLKDIAEAVVYPHGTDASEGITVQLLETGPDTSEFHSIKPVSVASLNAKPGQKIIVRSGLRGTSVRVRGGSQASRPVTAREAASTHGESGKLHGNKPPSKQSKSGTNQTAAGGAGGNGQVTIPVRGSSSRKHVGVPVKTKPARQKSVKPVQWEAYKLQFFASMHAGGLPKMNVIKIAFRRSANLAQLLVKSYPVSLSRDDRTGKILWSVNWDNGDIEDQKMSSNPPAMDTIQQKANDLRRDTVSKSALDALINSQLRPNARHL